MILIQDVAQLSQQPPHLAPEIPLLPPESTLPGVPGRPSLALLSSRPCGLSPWLPAPDCLSLLGPTLFRPAAAHGASCNSSFGSTWVLPRETEDSEAWPLLIC